jgi:TPR repeat protein
VPAGGTKAGDTIAMTNLGADLEEDGDNNGGTTYAQAFHWEQKGAATGDMVATRLFGYLYDNGED